VDAIAQVADQLHRSPQVAAAGTANAFGDDQLNVDLIADDLIRDALAKCPSIATVTSEEDPTEKSLHHLQLADSASEGDLAEKRAVEARHTVGGEAGKEQYTVAFDPLDGSSIIGPNWTVGTIVGIWDGTSAIGKTPNTAQVAAIIGVIGPRTTLVIALNIPDQPRICFEIGVHKNNSGMQIALVRPSIRFASPPFETRYFAPANLRAAADDRKYARLVTHFIESKYTLRYSGGLVPDVIHMLVKGHGVYISPVTKASKAKLRLLYELYPIALVVECAGGVAVNAEDGKDILQRILTDCDERAGLICGTREDVTFVDAALVPEKNQQAESGKS
jgi:sedoheptulose-bisphosphatase